MKMQRRSFTGKIAYVAGSLVLAGLPYGIARLLAPSAAAVLPDSRQQTRKRLRPPGAIIAKLKAG
ncbi:MAG TPA: hypothetical protein ENI62_02955 [Gammaproteobacteria bacterium]|nr:hypothetical protein [Gammaproteobacteria bacterium]